MEGDSVKVKMALCVFDMVRALVKAGGPQAADSWVHKFTGLLHNPLSLVSCHTFASIVKQAGVLAVQSMRGLFACGTVFFNG